MCRLACLVAVILATPLLATEPTAADRERRVRVALALADVKAPAAVAAVPKAKFDWLGDETVAAVKAVCPCGPDCKCAPGTCPANCPATKAVVAKYRTEYRQECLFDQFGRRYGCHWVEYHVPINP
jgi:hypothetical protein